MAAPDPRRDLRWSDFIPETFSLDACALPLFMGYLLAIFLASFLLDGADWVARGLGTPLPLPIHRALQLWCGAQLELMCVAAVLAWDAPRNAERRRKEEDRMEKARASWRELRAKSEAARQPPPPEPPMAPSADPERPEPSYGCLRPPLPDERDDAREAPVEAVPPSGPNGFAVVRIRRSPEEKEPDPVPLPPALSQERWQALPDAAALLAHAIPRIPVRHTCLVLSQLVEPAWREWNRLAPDEWRPGWCLTVLRAWCLGEATLVELDQSRRELNGMRPAPLRRSSDGPEFPAALAAQAIRLATLYAGFHDAKEVSVDPARELIETLVRIRSPDNTAVQLTRWLGNVDRARRALGQRTSAELADCIRQWIPYPQRRSTQWLRGGSRVIAGDAVLTLEGRCIVEARPQLLARPPMGWN